MIMVPLTNTEIFIDICVSRINKRILLVFGMLIDIKERNKIDVLTLVMPV